MLGAAAEPALQPSHLGQRDDQLLGQPGSRLGRKVVDVDAAGINSGMLDPDDYLVGMAGGSPTLLLDGGRLVGALVRPQGGLLQSALVHGGAGSGDHHEQSSTRLLPGGNAHLMQGEPAVPGESGSGAACCGQLDPGGPSAQVPVHRRHHPNQLGLGEGVEQHQLPAAVPRHTRSLCPNPLPSEGLVLGFPSTLGAVRIRSGCTDKQPRRGPNPMSGGGARAGR
jgi:hypothetical protein